MAVISFHSSSGSLYNSGCFLHVHHFISTEFHPAHLLREVLGCSLLRDCVRSVCVFHHTPLGGWLGRSATSVHRNTRGALSACWDGTPVVPEPGSSRGDMQGRPARQGLWMPRLLLRVCNWGCRGAQQLGSGVTAPFPTSAFATWFESSCQLSVAAAFALLMLTE